MLPLVLLSIGLCFSLSDAISNDKKWAVLVAGSHGWDNYRHQSAVSHAYQLVKQKGIPQEHIITMMYDDIAYNELNPYPGQLFTDYAHKNRYKDITIDYREKEVTVANFLNVLKGDQKLKASGKKVVESGPEDNIFVFFSDHGATNLVAFPDALLYSDQFNDTLTWMHENARYKNMLLYIEACESGSMFDHVLSEDIGVFVTTSSNPTESGWACFCEDRAFEDTCLGDEYSVAWTADSEKHDINIRTIWQQYEATEANTESSHVQYYGDQRMRNMKVADFQGDKETEQNLKAVKIVDRQPARQTRMMGLHSRMLKARKASEIELAEKEIQLYLKRAELIESTFDYLKKAVKTSNVKKGAMRNKRETIECFREITDTFARKCYSIQKFPEVAGHLTIFDSWCHEGVNPKVVLNAIYNICE